jgi:CheY-like chemotaxis protein
MRTERPTVLVVDNVEEIVEELLTLMALHKIPATGAYDLDGALEVLKREPDVRAISCDVRLDRESGLDIVSRIADCPALHTRPFRYLFVTGDQMQLDALTGSGDLAVLSKPVQPRVLIDTLQQMLLPADPRQPAPAVRPT